MSITLMDKQVIHGRSALQIALWATCFTAPSLSRITPGGSSAFPPLRGRGWWDASGVDEFAFLVCALVVSCHNAFSAL
jgi:hypothetical protein